MQSLQCESYSVKYFQVNFMSINISFGTWIAALLALNYEIRLFKLNSLKHIKVFCFLFKIKDFLHQFTSMAFIELIMAIH